MGVGGQYTIRVHGMLDDTQIRAQLAALGKQGVVFGKGGKGAGGAYFAETGKQAKMAGGKVRTFVGNVDKATKQQKKFGATTLDVTKKVVQFGAVTAVIRGVTTGVGAMVQNVFELDSALVEFKKVSTLSEKGLKDYTKQAFEAGKATAKTGVEMLDAATKFKKMGYTEQESMQLATTATMFQNIADAEISAGDAAKFINSQMKAFSDDFSSMSTNGEKAQKIIDSVNEVANNYAVGTNDLQLALTKTSSAMSTFGNSFDETLGIMTAGTEIMVGMPSQVARGWRTIAANISNVGQSAKEYSDASGEVNITMKKQNGEIKTTYEFLKDLYNGQKGVSKSWKELNKDQKTAIALELAGKNNQEKFLAVMNNFQTAIEATETAQNSQGSAARENARYMDSLQGKVQALKSAWSEFSNVMINSDALKSMLGGLTSIMKLLSSDFGQGLVKVGGALLTARLGMKAFGSVSKKSGHALKSFVHVAGVTPKRLDKLDKKFNVVNKSSQKSVKGVSKLGKTLGKTGGTAAKSATKFAGLASVFAGGGVAWGILGAAGVAFGLYKLHQYLKEKSDWSGKYEETAGEIESLNEQLHTNRKRIAELQTKLDMGEELTSAEKKELKYLERETEELEKQLELKREIARFEFAKSVTEEPQKEKRKEVYQEERKKGTPVKEANRIADEAVKGYTKLDQITERWTDSNQKAKDALDAVNKAQKKFNEAEPHTDEWEKAAEDLDRAEKTYDGLTKDSRDLGDALTDELKEWDKLYDSVDDMPKEVQKSYKEAKKLSGAWEKMKGLAKDVDFEESVSPKQMDSAISSIKTLGENIGVTVDKAGNINKIDFSTFTSSMESMGFKAEDIRGILKGISEENPEATVTIDGTEVAIKDTDKVIEYLDKVNGDDADATIEIDGVEHAVSDIKTTEQLLDLMDGQEYNSDINVEGGDEARDDVTDTLSAVDKLDGSKYTGTLQMQGGEDAAEAAETVQESGESVNGQTYASTLVVNGAGEAAHNTGTVRDALSFLPPVKVTKVTAQTGGATKNLANVKKKEDALKNKQVKITATQSGKSVWSGLKSLWDSIKSKTVNIHTTKSGSGTSGHAKGTRNAPEGLSEVNEEGWEFIRDSKTGKLRVAGGGKRTVTYLNKGDVVYTHQESKQMVSEGEDVHISQHKKGKNNKKKKKIKKAAQKAQKAYDDAYNKRKDSYESAVDDLEHQAAMNHWSDKQLADAVHKLYVQRIKSLQNWNKGKQVKKWAKKVAKWKGHKLKKKSDFGKEVRYDQSEDVESAAHDIRIEGIENKIENLGLGKNDPYISGKERDAQLNSLASMRKKNQISAEEYKKYQHEIYKAYIDSGMKMYQAGKKSYTSMKKELEDYAKSGKITWAEYYEYIEDLMKEQLDKQKDALEKRKEKEENTYSLGKAYVQRQIDILEKANKEQEEQNELIEKQSELEKARSQRVKVYRQGQGFVYEQDTEAIREATKALEEYKQEQESPELKAWNEVLDLFDDLEAQSEIKDLENKVVKTVKELFGGFGTDTSKWTEWIKNRLSSQLGLENILEKLDSLEGWEAINDYLGSDGVVNETQIQDAIKKNRFASGTLSAPAGFARVAENGYEIALLGKGDAVMPHNISQNLMQWGRYNPIEVMQGGGSTTTQNYHFDKLVLPNVSNAQEFLHELHNLPNMAIQHSWGRG